jgi:hypothetical protein
MTGHGKTTASKFWNSNLPLRQRRSNNRTHTKLVFDIPYTKRNTEAQYSEVGELGGK